MVFEQDVLSQRASAQASAITGEGARRTPAIEMHVCWIGVIPSHSVPHCCFTRDTVRDVGESTEKTNGSDRQRNAPGIRMV